MPNMCWQLFCFAMLLFLFLLMMCGSSEAVNANGSNSRVSLFEGGVTEMTDAENSTMKQKFDSFFAPSLVSVNGVVVAFAEAHYKSATDEKLYVGIAAKSMQNDERTWTEGSAIVLDHYDVQVYRMLRPTPIVEDNDVDVLLGCYGDSGEPLTAETAGVYWSPREANGKVLIDDNGRKKTFGWHQQSTSPVSTTVLAGLRSFKQFLGGGGAGIRLGDKSFVLPVQALKDDGKKVSLLILAKSTSYGWEFSGEVSDAGCLQPAVLEWKENELLMMTSCADGSRRVYWSTSKGKSWTEAVNTLSRVWGNSPDRAKDGVQGGFISATIDEKKVILFSQPVYSAGAKEEEEGKLHLWLTDMKRIYDVGPISIQGEHAAASTLLHTASEEGREGGELYCAYEVTAKDQRSIAFVELEAELEKIKKVLEAWKEKDKHVMESYNCTDEKCLRPQDEDVGTGALTEGLAGFLSSKSIDADSKWKDEYLCVDATVHGKVEGTSSGLRFNGAGAGAEWPVGKQEQIQRYNFANYAFTLVAKVTINAVPGDGDGSIPLMGAKMNDGDNSVLFGLSHTKDKKWEVTFNGEVLALSTDEKWEEGKTYHVALAMDHDDGLAVYVGGTSIYDSEDDDDEDGKGVSDKLQNLLKLRRISHFYFGRGSGGAGGAGGGIDVTVADALLYNRMLSAAELAALTNTSPAPPGREAETGVSNRGGAPPSADEEDANEPTEEPAEETHVGSPEQQGSLQPQETRDTLAPAGDSLDSKADEEDEEDKAGVEEKHADEGSDKSAAPSSSSEPAAGAGDEKAETEMAASGQVPEQEHEHSPPAPESATGRQVVSDSPQKESNDDQAQQQASSHAPAIDGGVQINSATPTNGRPNVSAEENGAEPQTAADGSTDASERNTNHGPGQPGVPPVPGAAAHFKNGSLHSKNFTGLLRMNTSGDGTVRGCVARLLLLALLGLWGIAALPT
ncbi:complement regulatory protein [Trypanosoma rangeli]|uniref:Complement regulatory protein n=1 Tax=Trypanosoma rangeli TaxID=5698 RepID=A0A422MRG1_TRYRA|nr:complement regulatory protein [Trypanosoma rangeli]RNE95828.1 complement regulatory protein [Trypanosoma rangeli]|eukprot:RNE95828.1 complement regulatory protein [Trypanosoma rangeli]